MTIGQRIQELRKQAGLSQEALGEALGVSRQAVSKWESDGGIPELESLIAMSRLFGISIGALLGVEEPSPEAEEGESSPAVDEERVEAILRRYVEESRPVKPTPAQWLAKWGWIPTAAVVLVTVLAVLLAQVGSLRSTVKLLRGELSQLESRMSNELTDVTVQLRDILKEEGNLLSSFQWDVVEVEPEKRQLTVEFDANLKTYSPGMKMRLVLEWERDDGEKGQVVSDWTEGPYFVTRMDIPMNYRLSGKALILDENGVMQEQPIEPIVGGMNEEGFWLDARNLQSVFGVSYSYSDGFGSVNVESSASASEEGGTIPIRSFHPDLIYPTEARLTLFWNSEVIPEQILELKHSGRDPQVFLAKSEEYLTFELKEGDTLKARLIVVDNLGREMEVYSSWKLKDGMLEIAKEEASYTSLTEAGYLPE